MRKETEDYPVKHKEFVLMISNRVYKLSNQVGKKSGYLENGQRYFKHPWYQVNCELCKEIAVSWPSRPVHCHISVFQPQPQNDFIIFDYSRED